MVRLAGAQSRNYRRVALLVTLDVTNAFISARWCHMLEALENCFYISSYLCRILRDYLKDHLLLYEIPEGRIGGDPVVYPWSRPLECLLR